MKLKRFYQYVESKNYDVAAILAHPAHNETFFNMLSGVNYTTDDKVLFADLLQKNLQSDLVTETLRIELINYFSNSNLDTQQFLNEGFFDKLKQGWDSVKDTTKEISDQAKEVLGNIIDKAKNAVDFVKKVKDYIADAVKRLLQAGVEKIKTKLKADKNFLSKVEAVVASEKEGLKKDLLTAKEITTFYKTELLTKLNELIQKNVPATLEGEAVTDDQPKDTDKSVEILIGQKYMYLNSQGKDLEVSVVADPEKSLVQVMSNNSKQPFKVDRSKLRIKDDGFLKATDANKPGMIPNESYFYTNYFKLNENVLGDLIHKVEAIPPFSWLNNIKEIGEKGVNAIIGILSDVTAKLGGPKFVLPVIASLLGLALEYNIKGLSKHGLIDVASYFTVPFLIPIIKFIGYVATFIAAVIAINDIANLGIIAHHDAHTAEQPAAH